MTKRLWEGLDHWHRNPGPLPKILFSPSPRVLRVPVSAAMHASPTVHATHVGAIFSLQDLDVLSGSADRGVVCS
ncbi:hypothetical protein RRG08_018402 [Elysia crispata]|uniref:Uncharacterized protein n=1 Tax=Elysia crispata TaxID=231223 RepID=A0AAE0ZF07_9GAST|nr:hypothetical protein RRG08_018402 [Elysia crispata]